MKFWLKIVCVVLLLYVAVFSLWHPLVPGGLAVENKALHPGLNKITFIGYNTHFKSAESSLQAFVAVDKNYYCSTITQVDAEDQLVAEVILPDTVPSPKFSFYVNNDSDGTIYVEKATDTRDFFYATNAAAGACEVKVNHDEHSSFGYPFQVILFESIRNLMWHVPMWFTMFLLMGFSFAYSLRVLRQTGRSAAIDQQMSFSKLDWYDNKAAQSASVGLLFCTLGLITGSLWARFTWGTWWTMDPQLNGAMVVFLMYGAYFILRNSVADEERKARLSAIFNVFAFVLMVVLLMVMPRFVAGLHPGKSGNPAFSKYDLDSSLRTVFYPAVIGWALLGYWIYDLKFRITILASKNDTI